MFTPSSAADRAAKLGCCFRFSLNTCRDTTMLCSDAATESTALAVLVLKLYTSNPRWLPSMTMPSLSSPADEYIVVAAEIFCSAMDNDISAKVQRSLEVRCQEGVVYDNEKVIFVGDFADST